MNLTTSTPSPRVMRALLSVSDKTGIVELAKGLVKLGVELVSTGGTAKALREAGLSVLDVALVTGMPEMMDGRVKTLHPKIHGALLGRAGVDDAVMAEFDIHAINLLVVNLYPFQATIAQPNVQTAEAIENIDIGGPAMVRAASKNHDRVLVLTDPNDYAAALVAINSDGNSLVLRRSMAAKAFAHTAQYDAAVASYLFSQTEDHQSAADLALERDFPRMLCLPMHRHEVLRYGENPHQRAALYLEPVVAASSVASAQFKQGKSLSFNNLADADAALECVKLFDEPACVIVKHANPCGVAVATTNLEAYDQAYHTDPISAFGGIIAFNRVVDAECVKAILARQFVEVVIAPEFSELAMAAFASKPNVRVLATGNLNANNTHAWRDIKRIQGGYLVQDGDRHSLQLSDYQVVTERAPTAAEFADLTFAWKVAMQVKSNAIVYARNAATVGIGAGQMSRVISAKIAAMKALEANLVVPGSVMASDAFFPFRDGIDAAASVGIKAVIQPGGSMRDKEVIEAANQHRIAMVFTGVRHFKH
jgi:phosphoribosylaminoimidazolecarboxamide formyltransferase / IMP cyclohydrolase